MYHCAHSSLFFLSNYLCGCCSCTFERSTLVYIAPAILADYKPNSLAYISRALYALNAYLPTAVIAYFVFVYLPFATFAKHNITKVLSGKI